VAGTGRRRGTDADGENGPAARSYADDAHDCIMVRIQTDLPYTSLSREERCAPWASSPRISTDRQVPSDAKLPIIPVAVHHRSACSGVKALRNSSAARRQAATLYYPFGPLTPSARSTNLIAGDGMKNGFPASEQRTGYKPKTTLDTKSPIQVCELLVPKRLSPICCLSEPLEPPWCEEGVSQLEHETAYGRYSSTS
jgi:hypothetical protein